MIRDGKSITDDNTATLIEGGDNNDLTCGDMLT